MIQSPKGRWVFYSFRLWDFKEFWCFPLNLPSLFLGLHFPTRTVYPRMLLLLIFSQYTGWARHRLRMFFYLDRLFWKILLLLVLLRYRASCSEHWSSTHHCRPPEGSCASPGSSGGGWWLFRGIGVAWSVWAVLQSHRVPWLGFIYWFWRLVFPGFLFFVDFLFQSLH